MFHQQEKIIDEQRLALSKLGFRRTNNDEGDGSGVFSIANIHIFASPLANSDSDSAMENTNEVDNDLSVVD